MPSKRDATPPHVRAEQCDEDEADDEALDDEDTRRRTYLRRHRALLEQKRRLETERRLHELEQDKAAIARRCEQVLLAKQQFAVAEIERAKHKLRGGGGMLSSPTKSLPSLGVAAPSAIESSLSTEGGMYSKFDELSADTLRAIAEKQDLREMTPLNTRGKYHARFMANAYPVAGSQLKLEKERDTILAAKKKLLLTKAPLSPMELAHTSGIPRSRSIDVFAGSYRKLDFYVDKFATVLKCEENDVRVGVHERHVRLADTQHREGFEQFWMLMHNRHTHEAVAWLNTHRFRDINVPVVFLSDSRAAAESRILPNKDVGVTPLMAACRLHSVDIVMALLEQDAAVYLSTANGDTALHFLFHDWIDTRSGSLLSLADAAFVAVKATHVLSIMTQLIARQADVNAQNAFGETALQQCARLGLEDCVKLLLAHDADVYAEDRDGHHALHYAQLNAHEGIVRMLQNFRIIAQTRRRELERFRMRALLQQKRGTLTADWSESPDKLLARLAVEDRRAGHLRNQYIDRHGNVIAAVDDDDEHDDEPAVNMNYKPK